MGETAGRRPVQALRFFSAEPEEAIFVAGSEPPTQPVGIWPSESLLGTEILEATVDLVISLVTHALEAADGLSVSLVSRDPGKFHTPSATSAELRDVDAVQYRTSQGPCVQAARTGEVVNVVLAAAEACWPEFTRHAARQGIGSVLSVPLVDDDVVIGALNVYSQRGEGFSDHDQQVVTEFARPATLALKHASEFMTREWMNEQLAKTLSTADVIGQAKGILMAKGYSPDQAWATLRRTSDVSNRKLSEVAQDMITSSRRVRPT